MSVRCNIMQRRRSGYRDKWKKTMHKRIQETKQVMMRLTDNQLEMTTKRTIMENEQMSAEIAYQSRQTNSVMAANEVLDVRVAELKQELMLSRDTENELAKRNTVYQNTIKQLVCCWPCYWPCCCCSRFQRCIRTRSSSWCVAGPTTHTAAAALASKGVPEHDQAAGALLALLLVLLHGE